MGSLLAPLIVLSAATSFAPFVLEAFGLRAFVATYALAAAAWLWLRRTPAALPSPAIMAIAVLLRLAFVAQPAMLSTDVYRYLWDGRVFANGINPYAHAPDDQALAALRTPWHSSINHPEIPTIYPPHAELLFGAVGLVGAGLVFWRLTLLAADLALILLLMRHGPRPVALAYATFPPLLIECSWNGHIEMIAALLLFLAWSNLAKSEARSATALAIAAGVKLIPIAAVPAMLIAASRRMRYALIFALVLILPAIAFLLAGPLMPGFHDYATRWIFNSPIYDALSAAIGWYGVAPALKSIWTSIKDPLHLEPVSRTVYELLYPDFLARVVLALLAIAGIAIMTRRACTLHRRVTGAIGALLLCSPAIHPWYWITLVPMAFVGGADVWLMLALFAPLSYLLYAGVSKASVLAICYALPLLLGARPSRPLPPGVRARREPLATDELSGNPASTHNPS